MMTTNTINTWKSIQLCLLPRKFCCVLRGLWEGEARISSKGPFLVLASPCNTHRNHCDLPDDGSRPRIADWLSMSSRFWTGDQYQTVPMSFQPGADILFPQLHKKHRALMIVVPFRRTNSFFARIDFNEGAIRHEQAMKDHCEPALPETLHRLDFA